MLCFLAAIAINHDERLYASARESVLLVTAENEHWDRMNVYMLVSTLGQLAKWRRR